MKHRPAVVSLLAFAVIGLSLTACRNDDDAGSDKNTLDAVSQALLQKNDWDPDDVEITLDRIDAGKYATGGVRDTGGGGGLWFAALADGEWHIVWDGNGIIPCTNLDAFPDYPTSLVPQCLGVDGAMRQR